jgi:galactokinase
VSAEGVSAFAPGRVNLIGEHTDYNGGLALPFAIEEGVTVVARRRERADDVLVEAETLGESDRFSLAAPGHAAGWRAYVRGVVAELGAAGVPLEAAEVDIDADLARGAGLSSSAALQVALAIAMIELARPGSAATFDRVQLAKLCSRAESEWAGAMTGLLDQLASLFGRAGCAVLIDFATLAIQPIPVPLDGWRLAVVDSGDRHAHGTSGYNERRAECVRACELLGLRHLSEATREQAEQLPEPLRSRALHVVGENERVLATVGALRTGDMLAVAALLDASHGSERDLFAVSTPAVERTVEAVRAAGAAGARLIGGGFGGSVLGLFGPGASLPELAREVQPSAGARLLTDY